jgi:tetrapyrrole methylase family protein/MazG family protein
MSSLDLLVPICAALNLDPFTTGLQLLDATSLFYPDPSLAPEHPWSNADAPWCEKQGLARYHPPPLPTPLLATRPALIRHVGTQPQELAATLHQFYPANHQITLIDETTTKTTQLPLTELSTSPQAIPNTWLYLPALAPLDNLRSNDGLAYVIARLLGPAGCPWDREQTYQSLRRSLLGEVYEVLEALDTNDLPLLAEELGDVLLNVLVQIEMGRQHGAFTPAEVYQHVTEKLIRRHPHVFGDLAVADSDQVLTNWEAIKQAERAAKGAQPRGLLDGIPADLPALMVGQELTRKAARAGFDSPEIELVWDKISEEIAEIQAAQQINDPVQRRAQLNEELGDLLLIIAKLAWRLDLDAESALREASHKFRRRFTALERILVAERIDLKSLSTANKLALWHRARAATETHETNHANRTD